MGKALFAGERLDDEIDARVLEHPFRIAGAADGRLRTEQGGIEKH
jgi:transcriptional regulator